MMANDPHHTIVERPGTEAIDEDVHCIRLLVANGYLVGTVRRRPASTEIECLRLDEFGAGVSYLIAVARDQLQAADIETLRGAARHRNAQLVVVSQDSHEGVISITLQALVARMGGPIESILPLAETYRDELIALGRNEALSAVAGDPSTAYEGHVHAGLRFLLGARVIRYGQDRRFEAVPDGFGLLPGAPAFLYDAKASRDGYNVDRDTIRQFGDYVRLYSNRYSAWLGTPFVFVVVSTDFADDANGRQERSRELYADCQVPLAFLTSSQLADSIALVSAAPWARAAVDWKRVFAPVDITADRLEREVTALDRDRILK